MAEIEFHIVHGLSTFPAGDRCAAQDEHCRGRLQWHHAIPQQRIRRAWKAAKANERRTGEKAWTLTSAVKDERNRIVLCFHHHFQLEQRKLYVTAPESAREFAAEYGLLAELEADESRGLYGAGRAEGAA